MVQHDQDFLARRRELRPADEYIYVTPREWSDFEEHFDKRKVELGSCARPYGTPCQHEHDCVRCPMLHVDPRMLPFKSSRTISWCGAAAPSTRLAR